MEILLGVSRRRPSSSSCSRRRAKLVDVITPWRVAFEARRPLAIAALQDVYSTMTPDAEAEARFMQLAAEAGLQDCGCRVSNHSRAFSAWAFAHGAEQPFEVTQDVQDGIVQDDQMYSAIARLKTLVSGQRR